MNKLLKLIVYSIIIAISTLVITNVFNTYSYAQAEAISSKQVAAVQDPTKNPNAYKPGSNTYSSNSFDNKISTILGAITAIGTIVSVGVLIVIGIKYILGSAEERSNYKETLLPYLVGAILLFAATALPQVIYKFIK